MRNAILRDLQAEYEQQRMRNDQENQRRLVQATAACPEIADLMDDRQSMIFAGLRGILDGRVQGDDLPARMDVMNGRIAALLTQHGFAADYLEPVYRCAKCKDTGYVGEPVKDMCECMRSAFYARLYQQVGLGEKAPQTFESFDLNVFPDKQVEGQTLTQRQMMQMIRDMCQGWADQYPRAETSDMLLTGPSGLGKTSTSFTYFGYSENGFGKLPFLETLFVFRQARFFRLPKYYFTIYRIFSQSKSTLYKAFFVYLTIIPALLAAQVLQ